jgi:hypothetical protein
MFRGLINDAKSAASSVILRYLARASVAIPFLIAAGFAIAAITVTLVNTFGHTTAYWMMAGGLAAIGIVASLVVSVKEHEEEVAEQQAEQTDTSEMAAEVAKQAPLAMLGALFAMPGGGTAALKVAQLLGRNFPLVLLLVLIGALFWPSEPAAEAQEQVEPVEPLTTTPTSPSPSPDGFDRPSAGTYTH